jgi:DNA-binding XRE family transcriptional regulator
MADFKISLAAARVNANMTQDQVAEALSISKVTLINWEKGKTKIPFASLVDLCTLYKFPIDHISLPNDLT